MKSLQRELSLISFQPVTAQPTEPCSRLVEGIRLSPHCLGSHPLITQGRAEPLSEMLIRE